MEDDPYRSRGQSLEELIQAVDDPGRFDLALGVVGEIYSSIPIAGGAVAAMVAAWREGLATARLVAVLHALDESLQVVRHQLDSEFLRTSEARDALDAILESATEARHADKRQYYAALLARTATRQRPGEAERALMLDTLDALRPTHLAVLAAVASDPKPPGNARAYFQPGTAASAFLRAEVPGASPDVLDRCWEDLAGYRVLASITIPIAAGTAYPSAVTGFGRRFLAFITPLAAVSEIGEPMDLSPAPTAEQLAELDEELRPLREENPDVPDDVIMGSVPAKHVIFEWRRRHGLLSDEAS